MRVEPLTGRPPRALLSPPPREHAARRHSLGTRTSVLTGHQVCQARGPGWRPRSACALPALFPCSSPSGLTPILTPPHWALEPRGAFWRTQHPVWEPARAAPLPGRVLGPACDTQRGRPPDRTRRLPRGRQEAGSVPAQAEEERVRWRRPARGPSRRGLVARAGVTPVPPSRPLPANLLLGLSWRELGLLLSAAPTGERWAPCAVQGPTSDPVVPGATPCEVGVTTCNLSAPSGAPGEVTLLNCHPFSQRKGVLISAGQVCPSPRSLRPGARRLVPAGPPAPRRPVVFLTENVLTPRFAVPVTFISATSQKRTGCHRSPSGRSPPGMQIPFCRLL